MLWEVWPMVWPVCWSVCLSSAVVQSTLILIHRLGDEHLYPTLWESVCYPCVPLPFLRAYCGCIIAISKWVNRWGVTHNKEINKTKHCLNVSVLLLSSSSLVSFSVLSHTHTHLRTHAHTHAHKHPPTYHWVVIGWRPHLVVVEWSVVRRQKQRIVVTLCCVLRWFLCLCAFVFICVPCGGNICTMPEMNEFR